MQSALRLDDPALPVRLGALVREARTLIGWSQDELATRARTSQTWISRLEAARLGVLDLHVAARVLTALGLRGALAINDLHLDDRRQQRDAVHAHLLGYVARRLRRAGWLVETEVPIGRSPPRGWIDLVAFRPADRASLLGEIKGDIPDVGAMQRQVAFYAGHAREVFAFRGWQPRSVAVLVAALASTTVADRLADHRHVLAASFPGAPRTFEAWATTPGAPPPRATIACVDPTRRHGGWLLRTPLTGRRSPSRYARYADAADAIRFRRRRPRAARPRDPP